MKNLLTRSLLLALFAGLFSHTASAGFPDDFSDVTWLDPNVSGWAQTALLTVDIRGDALNLRSSKRNSWPQANNPIGVCCNANAWVFAKYEGQWYASTFEYMRVGQVTKSIRAVGGGHIKRPPFLRSGFVWKPKPGEVIGFMVSGVARFTLDSNNIRERSNVAFYRWGVGPVDASEANVEPVIDDEDECTEPELPTPVNNTHTYNGTATATITATGPLVSGSETFEEPLRITVADDRRLTFTIDDESFSTQVGQDGRFSGTYIFDIGNAGVCLVSINVQGLINGNRASGTANGNQTCDTTTASLTGNFVANSATAPNYLDQRPPLPTPRSTCGIPSLAPIYEILLRD